MTVEFNGFRQTDVAVSAGCHSISQRYCATGFASVGTSGHRWGGDPISSPGSVNKTFTIVTGTSPPSLWIKIVFSGSANMGTDPDYTPATGTGIWEIKLHVITGNPNIKLSSASICLTDTRCSNLGTIFSATPNVVLSTNDTVHEFSGLGTLSIDWHSTHRLAYVFVFINLNTSGSEDLTYLGDQKQMYPRPGHNQIGLGTGYLSRDGIKDVPLTFKRHTLVGQPG